MPTQQVKNLVCAMLSCKYEHIALPCESDMRKAVARIDAFRREGEDRVAASAASR